MGLAEGRVRSEGDRETVEDLRARLERAECAAAEATARCERITSANDALRRSAGQLPAVNDIDSYLGQVLLSIVEELGGMSGTVYTHDPAASVNRLRACVVDGRAFPARQADHPYASRPMPSSQADIDRIFPNLGTPDVTFYQHDIAEERGLEPSYVAYVRATGARVNVLVPIALCGRVLGFFAIRFPEPQQLSDEKTELFKALAHHAATALRLWELGEQARDAAVAREREVATDVRAAKLAEASALMRRMAEVLHGTEDVRVLLGNTLKTIIDVLGLRYGQAWTVNRNRHTLDLRFAVEDGRLLEAEDTPHPNVHDPLPLDQWAWVLEPDPGGRRPVVTPTQSMPKLTPEQLRFLSDRDTRRVLSLPMGRGADSVGVFAIHLDENRECSADDLELVQVLANQAALAIRLGRLSEEARSIAVAREREEGERRRAQALERISRVERQTLERLAEVTDFERFLENVTAVAATQFGAIAASIWILEDDKLQLLVSFEEGAMRRRHESNHPYARDGVAPSDNPHQFAMLRRGEIAITTSHDLYTHERYEPVRPFLLATGIRSAINIPLFFGHDYRGAIWLRFDHDKQLTDEERDLAKALANQAVLAIQMGRMAARERESALEAERGRLAREIHDTLAQGFAAIAMRLTTIQREYADRAPSEVAKAIADAGDVARSYLVEARHAFAALKFHAEYESLSVGLEHLVDAFRRSGENRIEGSIKCAAAVPDAVAFELLRIAREALNNALRHAQAQRIRVELSATPDDDGVRLVVADDGGGFDPDGSFDGFGLRSMRERVEEIGASLTLISAPGEGVQIVVTWYARTGSPSIKPAESTPAASRSRPLPYDWTR